MSEEKFAIVTGASKGIGKATAKCFLEQGYQVINLSRRTCDVSGVRNISWDLLEQDWADNSQELLAMLNSEKPVEICLVHNSALMGKETVKDIKADDLRRAFELNVVAPARLNTLLLPKMSQGSSIVYISSTLGTKAVANTHSYVTTKHAVIGQMRASCQDLAGSMIHTAAVCPGFTETEMLQEHLGDNPEIMQTICAGIAHGRLVQPEEIAKTIWFVSQNPAINGAVLHANLGQIES